MVESVSTKGGADKWPEISSIKQGLARDQHLKQQCYMHVFPLLVRMKQRLSLHAPGDCLGSQERGTRIILTLERCRWSDASTNICFLRQIPLLMYALQPHHSTNIQPGHASR